MKRDFGPLAFLAILLLFAGCLFWAACNPVEEITDTYGDIVDEILPEDDDSEQNIAQVIPQISFTAVDTASFSITLIKGDGNVAGTDIKVSCSFTDPASGDTTLAIDAVTTDGLATCGIVNTSLASIERFLVATAKGVSSDPQFFFLGTTQTT